MEGMEGTEAMEATEAMEVTEDATSVAAMGVVPAAADITETLDTVVTGAT